MCIKRDFRILQKYEKWIYKKERYDRKDLFILIGVWAFFFLVLIITYHELTHVQASCPLFSSLLFYFFLRVGVIRLFIFYPWYSYSYLIESVGWRIGVR